VLDENTIEMPLLHVGGDGFSLDESCELRAKKCSTSPGHAGG